jgi:N-acetylmuramoyl-L-alanine amidase
LVVESGVSMRGALGLAARVNGRLGRVLAVFAVLGLGVVAAAAAQEAPSAGVLKVRLGGDARQTRVVVELDRSVQGKMIASGGASRQVIVALPQAAVVTRRFLLAPGDGVTVYRYVIDLTEQPADAAPVVAAARPAAPVEKVKAPLQPLLPAKKVVVIDAGHGGKDPGASGAESREKDLTLAAARSLRDRLERSGRYKVVLTRDTVVFIPLERRVQIARRANADLFLSLHADSGGDPNIRGATAYTLSEKGADRAARHATDGDGFLNVSLPGADASVNRILLDLTQRGTVNRSAAFAEGLLVKIGDVTPLLRRSHRDAGFMVLLAPDVPAVLLEMGFITNRDDEKTLTDSGRRRDLMDAAGDAIDDYFGLEARYALR